MTQLKPRRPSRSAGAGRVVRFSHSRGGSENLLDILLAAPEHLLDRAEAYIRILLKRRDREIRDIELRPNNPRGAP
jgi:hypothetical protein